MKKIYSIGTACLDIFFIFKNKKRNFRLGEKIEPDDFFIDLGGGGLNGAYNFKNLGFDSLAIVKLGNDFVGRVIKKRIGEKKINAKIINYKGNSTLSFILLFIPNQIIFTHRGESEFKLKDIPIDENSYYFIFTGNTKTKNWLKIIKTLKNKNNLIGINPSKNFLEDKKAGKILNLVNFVNFNEEEAEIFLGEKLDKIKLCREIREKLKNVDFISITFGKGGCALITKDKIFLAPILERKIVDTTGAGDSFSTTLFAYLISKNLNIDYIKESIKKAVINTTYNLKNIGAQTGLLKKKDLEKLAKRISLNIKTIGL
jgi:ribokinase